MHMVTIRPGQGGQLGSVVPKPFWSQKVFYAQEFHMVMEGTNEYCKLGYCLSALKNCSKEIREETGYIGLLLKKKQTCT